MKFSGKLCNDDKEQLNKFCGDLDCNADPPNRESGQYGGNELPGWRSAL